MNVKHLIIIEKLLAEKTAQAKKEYEDYIGDLREKYQTNRVSLKATEEEMKELDRLRENKRDLQLTQLAFVNYEW